MLRVHERVHDQFHAQLMIRDGKSLFEHGFAGGFVGDISFGKTDFLYQALGSDCIIGCALHIK